MSDGVARLADGRRLGYARYGDPQGRPLVVCHGDAQSRLGYRWMDDAAARRHVLLICPERPGYGRSDPAPPGYSFVDSVRDLAMLLEQLRVGEFTASGVSTGGGFALAAAATMGPRVLKTVVVSGLFPFSGAAAQRELAWYAPVVFWTVRHLSRPLGTLIAVAIKRSYASEEGVERLLRRLPQADRFLFDTDTTLRANLLEDACEATRQGLAGTVADVLCYARGLDNLQLSSISGPVVFVHGTADTIMKPNIALAAHRMVPGSELRWVQGGGHFILRAHPELLLDEVAPVSS
ncbi:MAG TPA: alpha/beta hydrolase [Mycobacterium sp.]|nr:alpha/beta hydrolase [Mycobacterium sp.]HTX95354.1 alpha/beta hydrolase [Mycobacterium sp.]